MKRTPLALTALAVVAALTLALLPAQQTVSADDHGDAHEKLEEIMTGDDGMASTYRSIRRQSRDASKNADTAEMLAHMIDLATQAKTVIPGTATTDEMKKSYRVIMNKLIIVTAQAENAALQGDQDTLGKLVREMNSVKGEGHEMFIPADE